MKNIAIIGAGASGLVAAIAAARKNVNVKVYEKNSKVGKKLLATGNGRCNMSNRDLDLSHFHGKNVLFAKPVLQRFNFQKCVDFFSRLGIEVIEDERGRVYPMSLQSSTVVDLLVYEAKRVGVVFELSSEVTFVKKTDSGFMVESSGKRDYFEKVLIAAGGLARPALGGCGSGYELVAGFGHSIVEPRPSLVQLVSDEPYLKKLSGVKFSGIVQVDSDKNSIGVAKGDVLFTDYGLSGSAILDISRKAGSALERKAEVEVVLDLLPRFSKEQLKSLLQKRLKFANDKEISFWLEGIINKKLISLVLVYAKLRQNIKYARELGTKDLAKIAYAIKNIKIRIIGTKGFKSAEVTAGGVDVREVFPESLESKLQKGLYFSGEVLDIDGDCGGYNLHWAWASGFGAGSKMADTCRKS